MDYSTGKSRVKILTALNKKNGKLPLLSVEEILNTIAEGGELIILNRYQTVDEIINDLIADQCIELADEENERFRITTEGAQELKRLKEEFRALLASA